MSTQIDLGPVLSVPKGDWNANTTYERLNLVRHNSASWICNVATSKGVEPTEDSTDWYLQVKDISSVTSVNGMKGDVVVETAETPSVNDSSTRIATTEWVTNKLGDVDLSGIKDDTIEAALNAGSLEIGTGDLTSAELAKIIEDNDITLRALIAAVQSSADSKLPLDGDKLFILRGINTHYVFSVNNTATALQIAAKNSEDVTKCVFFLNAMSGRITARVYNDSGESKDFYLNPDSWKAVWAGDAIVTEGTGTAYSAARTPNVKGVSFTGSSYTLPSGGTWSALFVDTSAAACGGWYNIAGGTSLNLGSSKTWRGLITRTA